MTDIATLVTERVTAVCASPSQLDRLRAVLPHLTNTERLADISDVHYVAPSRLNAFMDHTVLKNDATITEIRTMCHEAVQHQFRAVCVNGAYVPVVEYSLAECQRQSQAQSQSTTLPSIACVVGFPLGASATPVKAFEANDAVSAGASEIDMVVNLGHLKTGNFAYVIADISAVVEASKPAIVKVIIESAQLTQSQIIDACLCSVLAGAHFVKTSTGFSSAGGASVEAVRLMRAIVGDRLGVKASGGIRDAKTARAMIEAGATRLGVSAGVAIVSDRSSESQPNGY